VRSKKVLRAFVVILLVVAAANGIASFVQFNLTPAQFAAWGPGYSERVLGTGSFSTAGRTYYDADTGQGRTRPFGLGSDSGSGGAIAAYAIAGAFALASLFTRLRYVLLAVALAVGATTAILTSQARGAIVASVVILLVYVLITATSKNRLTSLAGVLLAGVVVFFTIHTVADRVGSATFRYEGLGTSQILQTTDKARGKSIARIPQNMANHPLGAGLGVAGPASTAPGASALTLRGRVDAETEFSFMTLETGIPGMLVLVGFVLALFRTGVRRVRREADRETQLLLAALVAPLAGLFVLFFASAATPTVPGGPYLWAVGGIVSYWLMARPAQRA
jgi:O-Antigen ligase